MSTCLQVHDRERVCGRETEQAQDLEHLDGGHECGAALFDDVGAGHDIALLGCEGRCHASIPGLHHGSLPSQHLLILSSFKMIPFIRKQCADLCLHDCICRYSAGSIQLRFCHHQSRLKMLEQVPEILCRSRCLVHACRMLSSRKNKNEFPFLRFSQEACIAEVCTSPMPSPPVSLARLSSQAAICSILGSMGFPFLRMSSIIFAPGPSTVGLLACLLVLAPAVPLPAATTPLHYFLHTEHS